jgi:hypothetical protein
MAAVPFRSCVWAYKTKTLLRLTADLLVMRLGRERFSWGRESLRDAGAVRQRYIAALQSADNHDIGPLLAFARS